MDGPVPEMFPQVPKSFFDALDESKMSAKPLREAAGEPTVQKPTPLPATVDLSGIKDPSSVIGDVTRGIYTTHDGRAFTTQAEAHTHLMKLRNDDAARKLKQTQLAAARARAEETNERHRFPIPGQSLEDEMMAIETAKIERYMQLAKPTLNALVPAFDRVERNQHDVAARLDALEKSWRRSFSYLMLANAAVLAFFYFAFRGLSQH